MKALNTVPTSNSLPNWNCVRVFFISFVIWNGNSGLLNIHFWLPLWMKVPHDFIYIFSRLRLEGRENPQVPESISFLPWVFQYISLKDHLTVRLLSHTSKLVIILIARKRYFNFKNITFPVNEHISNCLIKAIFSKNHLFVLIRVHNCGQLIDLLRIF